MAGGKSSAYFARYNTGATAVDDRRSPLGATRFSLSQNFPNPFNPATSIRYDIPFPAMVRLAVYDVRGREVALLENAEKTPGSYAVQFDADRFESGVYLYRLTAREKDGPGLFQETKKLMLVR
jgi:hypothetical protein